MCNTCKKPNCNCGSNNHSNKRILATIADIRATIAVLNAKINEALQEINYPSLQSSTDRGNITNNYITFKKIVSQLNFEDLSKIYNSLTILQEDEVAKILFNTYLDKLEPNSIELSKEGFTFKVEDILSLAVAKDQAKFGTRVSGLDALSNNDFITLKQSNDILTTSIASKVDKVEGKDLVETTEIVKLKGLNTQTQLDEKIGQAIIGEKGSIGTTDPAPTVDGIYRAKDAGTYTNLGGLIAKAGYITWFKKIGTTWSIYNEIEIEVATNPILDPNGTGIANEKATADYTKSEIAKSVDKIVGSDLVGVNDKDGKYISLMNNKGELSANLSDEVLETTKQIKEKTTLSNDIFGIEDVNGKFIPVVNSKGQSGLELDDNYKEEIIHTKQKTTQEEYLIVVEDIDGKIIPLMDKYGNLIDSSNNSTVSSSGVSFPIDKSKGVINVVSNKKLEDLILTDYAVGRESSAGANDAPRVLLENNGWTHPSVAYMPGGWNGFPFWMAVTPTFGKIAQQTDTAAYENPHLYCSMDGINWQTPVGLTNPLDTPDPADTVINGVNHGNSYWSDTDLKLDNKGFLNLYYRGNNMSKGKLNVTTGTHLRAVVHKQLQSPTKIGQKTLVSSTDTIGVNTSSVVASPGFINANTHWEVYDVVDATPQYPYLSDGCSFRAVMRRFGTSPTNFEEYTSENIIHFTSRPWGEDNEVWHLEAHKINGTYILLLNVGPNKTSIADSLWIAYSSDGWTFDIIQTPLFIEQTYRSTMILKDSSDGLLTFWVYRSNRITGEITLNEVKLNYL